jgi:hypothetical protein
VDSSEVVGSGFAFILSSNYAGPLNYKTFSKLSYQTFVKYNRVEEDSLQETLIANWNGRKKMSSKLK